MNRSALLSACVAASLLACTERSSIPAADAGAPASQATAPGPTALDAGGMATSPSAEGMTAGPGSSDAGSARCSASTLGPQPEPARPAPAPVESMRRRIVAAALACDYAALAALGDENGKGLRFSFGPGNDAAAFFREAEQQGDPVLARMVRILALPYAHMKEGDLYVWPAAHVTGLKSDADLKALVGIYPEEQLRNMRKAGVGYLGLRVGITPQGDWQLAVAGD